MGQEKQMIPQIRIDYPELPVLLFLWVFGISVDCIHNWEKRTFLKNKGSEPENKNITTPTDIPSEALDAIVFYNTWSGFS